MADYYAPLSAGTPQVQPIYAPMPSAPQMSSTTLLPPGTAVPVPVPVAAAVPVPVASSQPTYVGPVGKSPFQQFVEDNEIAPDVAADLQSVLTTTKVILLLDDSGSMNTRIVDPGAAAFAQAASGAVVTRWSELEKLAATAVEMITVTASTGLDVHFLNRGSLMGVTRRDQLTSAFAARPAGGTPLISKLTSIFRSAADECALGRRVLVIVITDGEPSDGSPDDLYAMLNTYLRRMSPNLHVSFAECNDNEEEMAYLDGWDNRLPNFDNTDDYKMEAMRVKAAQASRGMRVRFTYVDYVVKIILGSVLRRYFMMDQSTSMGFSVFGGGGPTGSAAGGGGGDPGCPCCTVV